MDCLAAEKSAGPAMGSVAAGVAGGLSLHPLGVAAAPRQSVSAGPSEHSNKH